MSIIGREKLPTNATAADCGRLWRTMTDEYIRGLRLEIRVVYEGADVSHLSVEVVDDSVISVDGREMVNIWASRSFRSELYLISVSQLFDLLIAAHRQMNLFFSLGSTYAPTLRPK